MTKPVTAVAALLLVEECRLRLDDPVDDLLPELADRRVLADPAGPLTETVPAVRPITLRDVLTFRLGLGMDFAASHPQPILAAMAELGVGAGPPAPGHLPPPDEWIARLGTLPLAHQPGERWLYHTGAEVLGVLVSRAAGQPLEAFMQERIFDPLGMRDTGFSVPPAALDRFGACYGPDPTRPVRPRGRAVGHPAGVRERRRRARLHHRRLPRLRPHAARPRGVRRRADARPTHRRGHDDEPDRRRDRGRP